MLFGSELLRPATRYPQPLALAARIITPHKTFRAVTPASPPISPHSPPAIVYCLPRPRTTSHPAAKGPLPASPTQCSSPPSHPRCSALHRLPPAASCPPHRRPSPSSRPPRRVPAPPTRRAPFRNTPERAALESPAPPPSSRGLLSFPRP